jgi:hypothetical protein
MRPTCPPAPSLIGSAATTKRPGPALGKVRLTAAGLARMLHEFGIASANRRWPDGSQTKGYLAEDFADSWARYCPPIGFGLPVVPSHPAVP